MVTINNVNATTFTYNGIPYFKNFAPLVKGNKVQIINTYGNAAIDLTEGTPRLYTEFTVNGSTYASVALLQAALLPILFTSSSLVNGGVLQGHQLSNEHEIEVSKTGSTGVLGCSLEKSSSEIVINKHLGSNDWLEVTMKNSGAVIGGIEETPYKLVKQRVYKLNSYLTINDATTITSGWSIYNSNDSTPYIGHRVATTVTQGETITFTAKFKGDLYLYYVGRNNGGIMSVTIDGGTPVNVDTYDAVNNNYKQKQFIEALSNNVEHTIVITNTGTTNQTGNQTWFNALEIITDEVKPGDPLVKPIKHKQGVTVQQYDEMIGVNGAIYVAQNSGITGEVTPSHSGGTVSDGSIDWLRVAKTSFSIDEFLIQKEGSELEYAYQASVNNGAIEDIGGNMHKNEFLSSPIEFFIDGIKTNIVQDTLYYGKLISIKQNIVDFYGEYENKVDIANVTQFHDFNNELINVRYEMKFLVPARLGWFYSAMFPFLTYSSNGFRRQFEEFYTPRFSVNLEDYESVTNNPIIGNKKDYIMIAKGRAYVPAGSAGVPSTDAAKTGITIALRTSSYGVNDFYNSTLNAGLAVNANSGSYTGYSSWLSKMYFQRLGSEANFITKVGEIFKSNNRYYVKLNINKHI
jgi:hypothetical protein